MWIDLREPGTEKLLARFEPGRELLEIQRRGVKTVIDLRQYQERRDSPRVNERQESSKST